MGVLGVASGTANAVKYVSSVANKKIKSDIQELESAITTLDQSIDGYNSVSLRIVNMINRIEPSWKGQNAEAYIGRLRRQGRQNVEMSKLLLRVRELAVKRKNKLKEKQIWAQEINNAANNVSKAIKGVKIISKIF